MNAKRIAPASLLCALLLPVVAHAEGVTDAEGAPYDLRVLRGQVVALTFAAPATRDEATRVNQVLEAQAGGAALVSIVDLSAVPDFLRGFARRKIAEQQRVRRVRLLVDEDGSLRRPLHVQPDRQVDILVLDRAGTVRGRFHGACEVSEALRLLAELHPAPAPAVALR